MYQAYMASVGSPLGNSPPVMAVDLTDPMRICKLPIGETVEVTRSDPLLIAT